jgi:hypothetical protein
MEGRLLEGQAVSIGETELSVRHVMAMKSGLVVHLYNVIESTMSGAMNAVGQAIGSVHPTEWTENALKEWLRKHAAKASDDGEDGRLCVVHAAVRHLLGTVSPDARSLKKPPGTWSDKLIFTFARRLGIQVRLPPDMYRRIQKRSDLRDMTPMGFVADRRNAIAHGRRSFEGGATDITLVLIRELADVAFDFLGYVVDAFEEYITNERYRVAEA